MNRIITNSVVVASVLTKKVDLSSGCYTMQLPYVKPMSSGDLQTANVLIEIIQKELSLKAMNTLT